MAKENTNPLARIPQVEKLLNEDILKNTTALIGRPFVVKKASEYLEDIRKKARAGGDVPSLKACAEEINKLCRPIILTKITPVINATGIILHTNLGRSPLPENIWDRAKETASGYSSIEMDLRDGNRGKRFEFLNDCMSLLTGAEDALILNNNAAAVFLMLKALAGGKEVIVSRGQQVQIGGGFRIPEILEMAGCKLIEVGTTNITSLKDIQKAINENTAMVLWVHTSNYKIRGFTEQPSISEIKAILPQNIILAVDQGSGNLSLNVPEEPTVSSIIKEGADLVCFSGDKILGGPQAGWIVGKKSLVQTVAKNQLMRTYRVGRAVASLMQECLILYLNGGESAAQRALLLDQKKIKKRAEKIIASLKSGAGELVQKNFSLGGGSTPDTGFSSWAVKLNTKKPCEKLKTNLREMPIPIIGFIEEDSFYIHPASIEEKYDEYVIESLNKCL
ncbi:L-seryl-tRNA(Sec) selenium transferase [Treponema denticola]|uniref:L-seryl-tRNA(Sec) selenium transferase n=1 Tax=Treponema denticola TaxID=158 RepID=UPI0020A3D397|nr:L-seryl-tRNA(Sec) selenium transferase [Treponema denticola]UTD06683.1 L-seryl-tRNA(Sec) selenium transferase [Treponema denticola]